MGKVRFLLALAVVFDHVGLLFGVPLIDGQGAVQAFFIVSGFYMELILSEKYNGETRNLFWSNRYLRVWPMFFSVVVLSFSGLLFSSYILEKNHVFFDFYEITPMFWRLWSIIANITGFGLDILLLVDTISGISLVNNLVVVPQSWTLSLELYFYIIAPYLHRKNSRILWAYLFASLFIKGVIYFSVGCEQSFWNYRFFPAELSLFIGGMVIYRLRSVILKRITLNIYFIQLLPFLLVFPAHNLVMRILLLTLTALSLPILFERTKYSKSDRALGEYSFPIYLYHVLVFWVIKNIHLSPWLEVILTILGSVFLSFLSIQFVINPIEKYRQGRVESK